MDDLPFRLNKSIGHTALPLDTERKASSRSQRLSPAPSVVDFKGVQISPLSKFVQVITSSGTIKVHQNAKML